MAPSSYKVAQITEKNGKFELVDRQWAEPKAGHVMVKVLACGVCHSDAVVVEQQMPTGLPRVPGHEIIGEVAAVPSTETRWKVGDRVGSGWHGGHDNTCESCMRGSFSTCDNENINGIITDGGYAEYALLRSEALLSVPTDIDPAEAAPLVCAGVTVFNSLRNMTLRPGDVVAVQGVGGLGHLALQFASKMGYRAVALSRGQSKKELAHKLGASDYIDSNETDPVEALQKLGGAKVVLCVAPSGEAMSKLIPGMAVDGQLLILAIAEPLTVPALPMIQKRLQIRGWPAGGPIDSQDTIAFAKNFGVKAQIEKFPLKDVQKAYDHMMSGDVRFRAVLIP